MKIICSIIMLLNIVSAWAGQAGPSIKEKYKELLYQHEAEQCRTHFLTKLDEICTPLLAERSHIDALLQECLLQRKAGACNALISFMEALFADAQYVCAHGGFDKAVSLAEGLAAISRYKIKSAVRGVALQEANSEEDAGRGELQNLLVQSRCTLCISSSDFEKGIINHLATKEKPLDRHTLERIVVDKDSVGYVNTLDTAPFAQLVSMARVIEKVVLGYNLDSSARFSFPKYDSLRSKFGELAYHSPEYTEVKEADRRYNRLRLQRPFVRMAPLRSEKVVDAPVAAISAQPKDNQMQSAPGSGCVDVPNCFLPSFANMIGLSRLFGTPCRVCEK